MFLIAPFNILILLTFFDGDGLAPNGQKISNKVMMHYKLLPALKVFNENIDKLSLGSMDGFALVDLEKGRDKVAMNGLGYCLYQTQEEIDEHIKFLKEIDSEYVDEGRGYGPRFGKTIDERYCVRKVRVSKENGIEFLD